MPFKVEQIFNEIGYHPIFRYEKFRTEYAKAPGTGKVLLDETPIGNYLEIEGSPRWIDSTARLLGFSTADYITRSYGYLYLAYCRERRISPNDMLFTAKEMKQLRKNKARMSDEDVVSHETRVSFGCATPRPIRWAWCTTPTTWSGWNWGAPNIAARRASAIATWKRTRHSAGGGRGPLPLSLSRAL